MPESVIEQQESKDLTLHKVTNYDISNISTDIMQVYPEAKIYTGTIESSFLYKRRYKQSGDHSTNEDHSYWWITIKTFEDKLVSYNISSEDKDVDSLKKGELISFIITKPAFLTRPLKIRKDKKIVKSDEIATTLIFHRKENGFYIINDFLKPTINNPGKLFGITFVIFFVLLILDAVYLQKDGLTQFFVSILKMANINKKGGFSLSIIIGLWIFIWLSITTLINKYNIAKHEKTQLLFSILKSTSKKLLSTFSDFQVTDKVPSGVEGGTSSSDLSIEDIEDSFTGLRNSNEDKFIFRHALSPNEKGSTQSKTYIAKVINKDLSVSASKSKKSYTQKTTTTYRDKQFGYKVDEKHSYRDFSHTTRSSIITGSIEVLTSKQEILEVNVPTDALRSIDVGDWLLLGEAHADIDGDYYHTNELTYNINKDIKTKVVSLASYGSISDLSKVIMTFAFGAVLATGYFTNIDRNHLQIAFFSFLGGVIALSCINILRNRYEKNKFLSVFKTAYKTCSRNRSEILRTID